MSRRNAEGAPVPAERQAPEAPAAPAPQARNLPEGLSPAAQRRILRVHDRRFYLAAFSRPPLIDTIRQALQAGANVNVDLLDCGALAIDAASLTGDLELMRVLLEGGAAVNHLGRDGFTALHRAALTGNLAMMRLLVTTPTATPLQMDLVTQSENNPKNPLTALQIVCTRGGTVEMAEFLIQHGANVHMRDQTGESLAHLCRTPALLACIRAHGVDVCEPAPLDNFTPLHYACLKGNLPVVQYLVAEAGADVHQQSKQGYNALHYAAHKGFLEICQWLVLHGGANPRETDDCGNTSFHVACTVKQTKLVLWFMEHCGFMPDEVAATGLSPLHYACLSTRCASAQEQSDGTPLVKALLSRQSFVPETPVIALLLHLASDWSAGICRVLVDEYNFNIMSIHKERIPLHRAARQGTVETVQVLAQLMKDRKLQLDFPDAHGWTALHAAVALRQTEKIRILLDAQCSVHAVDLQGRTPLYVAAWRVALPRMETPREEAEAAAFHTYSSDKINPVETTPDQDLEILQLLLDRGADPTRLDVDGNCPLSAPDASLTEVYLMMKAASTWGSWQGPAPNVKVRILSRPRTPRPSRKRSARQAKLVANKRMRRYR